MSSTIFYLGPVGTFTEQAACDFSTYYGGDRELVPCRTIFETIQSLDDADRAFAVVPYYNLIEGLIQETLDLMFERRLSVFAARQIPIRFVFGGYENGSAGKTGENVVYSHPKAIAQCSTFLRKNYPGALLKEVASTARSVVKVAEEKTGFAIARRETFEQYGVPILFEDVGNKQYSLQNYTEFLITGKTPPPSSTSAQSDRSRTLVAVMPTVDRVGLLADILGQIAFFGINLLKIHSRPALCEVRGKGKNAPQMFYLEMDIPRNALELTLCIESLNMRLSRQGERENNVVHILGDYHLIGN